MEFTNAQYDAITCRGGSVLVSAGAGSGKTRVLTERLMAYLDPADANAEPEEISRFLIITFTRAAAGELRGRIAEAIAARLRENPANAHLRRQLLLCRSAQIGTIHSFCATILREYAGQLGISPGFRILEEEKSERLREASLERVLEACYEKGDPDFLQLADRVGAGRDDSRLAELVLKLHASMQSHARPKAWADGQIAALSAVPEDIRETVWGKSLLKDAAEEAAFWHGQMEEAVSVMCGEPEIFRGYGESFCATADALRGLQAGMDEGWDAAQRCFPIPFPKLGRIRQNPDPQLSEALQERRNACKKAMEKLGTVFSGTSAECLRELEATAPEMKALLSAVEALEREFEGAKRRANALDFSDLEHLAVRLLTEEDGTPSAAAEEISSRFTEIMVDEYQDVSRVQDQIFHAVSRRGENLFFVGDLKQSIYRFRLADPEIFTEKNRRFAENARGERVIRLQENFRSRQEILDAVNAVFTHCMSERLGNLNYGDEDCLKPGTPTNPNGDAVPEVLLIPKEETECDALEAEAGVVAERIARLIQNTVIRTKDGERPMRFGDVAILLRSANAVGGVFRRVLLNRGIPVNAGMGGDFYESIEVAIVFSMLSVMDNPHRDIPLLSLLSSPAYGFTEEKLSMIRAVKPDTDFFTALCAVDDPEAKQFLLQLGGLRAEAPDLNAPELVARVMEELDLYALVSAMPDGEQRLHRLEDLSEMAEAFRRTGEVGLHRFVRWLGNMQKKQRDPETCAEGGDAVQILSIHRSKGLEFPVVFVCGLGRSFNRQDIRDTVLIHPVLGLGPKNTDPVRKLEYPTAARRAIERQLNREMLSEEMRLLYVAMTRAKDRLYLTACIGKTDEKLEQATALCAYPKVPARFLETASGAIFWVLPTAVKGSAMKLALCTLREEGAEEAAAGVAEAPEADPALLKLLERNFRYRYPYAAAEQMPSKLTATQLKEPDPDARPMLRESHAMFRMPTPGGRSLSPTQLGTATHLVLQQIDLTLADTEVNIRREMKRMEAQRFLRQEEAEAVDAERIYAFFASPLGKRIRGAKQVWREFRFTLLIKAGELNLTQPGDVAEEEQILLQGVVDCCFREGEALVVVDYKTDRVKTDAEIAERAEHYRPQIEAYAKALQRIFHLKVKEKILYFLAPDRSVSI